MVREALWWRRFRWFVEISWPGVDGAGLRVLLSAIVVLGIPLGFAIQLIEGSIRPAGSSGFGYAVGFVLGLVILLAEAAILTLYVVTLASVMRDQASNTGEGRHSPPPPEGLGHS